MNARTTGFWSELVFTVVCTCTLRNTVRAISSTKFSSSKYYINTKFNTILLPRYMIISG